MNEIVLENQRQTRLKQIEANKMASRSYTNIALSTIGRIGGAFAGAAAGALTLNPLGVVAGGVIGAGAGEVLGQGVEMAGGYRSRLNPLEIGVAGAAGAIPPIGKPFASSVLNLGARAAGEGLVSTGANEIISRANYDHAPTWGERAAAFGIGAGLGGALNYGLDKGLRTSIRTGVPEPGPRRLFGGPTFEQIKGGARRLYNDEAGMARLDPGFYNSVYRSREQEPTVEFQRFLDESFDEETRAGFSKMSPTDQKRAIDSYASIFEGDFEKPAFIAPKPAGETGSQFEKDFVDRFRELNEKAGSRNYIKVKDLRDALPQYTREQFDEGYRSLRKMEKAFGDSYQGQYKLLNPDEIDAGIASRPKDAADFNENNLTWMRLDKSLLEGDSPSAITPASRSVEGADESPLPAAPVSPVAEEVPSQVAPTSGNTSAKNTGTEARQNLDQMIKNKQPINKEIADIAIGKSRRLPDDIVPEHPTQAYESPDIDPATGRLRAPTPRGFENPPESAFGKYRQSRRPSFVGAMRQYNERGRGAASGESLAGVHGKPAPKSNRSEGVFNPPPEHGPVIDQQDLAAIYTRRESPAQQIPFEPSVRRQPERVVGGQRIYPQSQSTQGPGPKGPPKPDRVTGGQSIYPGSQSTQGPPPGTRPTTPNSPNTPNNPVPPAMQGPPEGGPPPAGTASTGGKRPRKGPIEASVRKRYSQWATAIKRLIYPMEKMVRQRHTKQAESFISMNREKHFFADDNFNVESQKFTDVAAKVDPDVLETKVRAYQEGNTDIQLTRDERTVLAIGKRMINRVHRLGLSVGLKSGWIGNYVPRVIRRSELTKGGDQTINEWADWFYTNNPAIGSLEAARNHFRNMSDEGTRFDVKTHDYAGNLESSRKWIYRKDMLEDYSTSLLSYTQQGYRRIGEVVAMGKNVESKLTAVYDGDGIRSFPKQYEALRKEIYKEEGRYAVRDLDDIYYRMNRYDANPEASTLAMDLRAIQYMSKLGPLSAINNLAGGGTQALVLGMDRRLGMSFYEAVANMNSADAKRYLKSIGVHKDTLWKSLNEEMRPVTKLQKLSAKYLGITGFSKSEEIVRSIQALTVRQRVRGAASNVNASGSKETLRQFLSQADADIVINGGKLTPAMERRAGWEAIRSAQPGDQLNRPYALSSEWGKVYGQFTDFAYTSSRFLRDHAWKQLKAGNPAPLATIILAGAAVGMPVTWIKDMARGKESKNDESMLKRYAKGIITTGGLGLYADLATSVYYDAQFGQPSQIFLGPTISDVLSALPVAYKAGEGLATGEGVRPYEKKWAIRLLPLGEFAAERVVKNESKRKKRTDKARRSNVYSSMDRVFGKSPFKSPFKSAF